MQTIDNVKLVSLNEVITAFDKCTLCSSPINKQVKSFFVTLSSRIYDNGEGSDKEIFPKSRVMHLLSTIYTGLCKEVTCLTDPEQLKRFLGTGGEESLLKKEFSDLLKFNFSLNFFILCYELLDILFNSNSQGYIGRDDNEDNYDDIDSGGGQC